MTDRGKRVHVLSLRLDDGEIAALDAAAERLERTRSGVARIALAQFLRRAVNENLHASDRVGAVHVEQMHAITGSAPRFHVVGGDDGEIVLARSLDVLACVGTPLWASAPALIVERAVEVTGCRADVEDFVRRHPGEVAQHGPERVRAIATTAHLDAWLRYNRPARGAA